ncbi:MAG: hypothetical protein ACW98I_16910 [Candidatus Hodarchaeales archaeon]|jgi:geranylgeranyl pyrophosphate synthase
MQEQLADMNETLLRMVTETLEELVEENESLSIIHDKLEAVLTHTMTVDVYYYTQLAYIFSNMFNNSLDYERIKYMITIAHITIMGGLTFDDFLDSSRYRDEKQSILTVLDKEMIICSYILRELTHVISRKLGNPLLEDFLSSACLVGLPALYTDHIFGKKINKLLDILIADRERINVVYDKYMDVIYEMNGHLTACLCLMGLTESDRIYCKAIISKNEYSEIIIPGLPIEIEKKYTDTYANVYEFGKSLGEIYQLYDSITDIVEKQETSFLEIKEGHVANFVILKTLQQCDIEEIKTILNLLETNKNIYDDNNTSTNFLITPVITLINKYDTFEQCKAILKERIVNCYNMIDTHLEQLPKRTQLETLLQRLISNLDNLELTE